MRLRTLLPAVLASIACAALVTAQPGGNLAKFPPADLDLRITTGSDGRPALSTKDFELQTGKYYRLNVSCPDVEDDLSGWRLEMPELLANSHLRLVSVGDIEIHLQGLSFRAIECDEAGTARVSFVPIRPGTYDLYVGNVPSAVGRPYGEAGVQRDGKYVIGRFVVE